MSEVWKGKHGPVLNYIHDRVSGDGKNRKRIFGFVNESLKGNFSISAVERLRTAILNRKGIRVATTPEDISEDCLEIGLGAEWGNNLENVVAWWTDRLMEMMFLKTYHLLNIPFDDMKNIKEFLDRVLNERKRRTLRC